MRRAGFWGCGLALFSAVESKSGTEGVRARWAGRLRSGLVSAVESKGDTQGVWGEVGFRVEVRPGLGRWIMGGGLGHWTVCLKNRAQDSGVVSNACPAGRSRTRRWTVSRNPPPLGFSNTVQCLRTVRCLRQVGVLAEALDAKRRRDCRFAPNAPGGSDELPRRKRRSGPIAKAGPHPGDQGWPPPGDHADMPPPSPPRSSPLRCCPLDSTAETRPDRSPQAPRPDTSSLPFFALEPMATRSHALDTSAIGARRIGAEPASGGGCRF
jgi:hypothetical protein